jgi:hypothetical protein
MVVFANRLYIDTYLFVINIEYLSQRLAQLVNEDSEINVEIGVVAGMVFAFNGKLHLVYRFGNTPAGLPRV